MKIENALGHFLHYIRIERNLSINTINSYRNDLFRYIKYLNENSIVKCDDITLENISEFFRKLSEMSLSSKSISRNFSALRSFHKYIYNEGYSSSNPTEYLFRPKTVKICQMFLNIMK